MSLLFSEMLKCGMKVKMTLRPGGAVRHSKNGAGIESVYRRQGFIELPIRVHILSQHEQGQVTWLV